jgi:hypothetical protein
LTRKTVREILNVAIGATEEDLLAFESCVRLGRYPLVSQTRGKWAGGVELIHVKQHNDGLLTGFTLCNLQPNKNVGSWSDAPRVGAKFCDTCLALALHADPEWRKREIG